MSKSLVNKIFLKSLRFCRDFNFIIVCLGMLVYVINDVESLYFKM